MRKSSLELDKELGVEHKVLDHGFVRVVDYMGTDESITQAARVSYNDDNVVRTSDEALIRYLVRHNHHTPLEMCCIKFHIKLPIFVMRQLIRHRIASVNECSGRYSIMDDDYYVPNTEHINEQSTKNNQGRGDVLPEETAYEVKEYIQKISESNYEIYKKLVLDKSENGLGVSKEIARMVLPINYYTQFYWSINARSLINFLKLRLDEHAQYEIRMYAKIIGELFQKQCPILYNAFIDYIKESISLSNTEQTVLHDLIVNGEDNLDKWSTALSSRERDEVIKKFPYLINLV